jgi:hypothetical protein
MIDGPPISRLDPNHPSLTAFEIEYKWRPIQDQDIEMGIYALFLLAVFFLFGLVTWTIYTHESRDIFMKNK